jgi:hypothetical protein
MAFNSKMVAEKIFNILKGFGYQVKSFSKDGKLVIDPQEATRFAVASPNMLIRFDREMETISLATGEKFDDERLREMLKRLSQDHLINFDYKKFNKKVQPKSEKIDIAQSAEKDMADVMEGFGPMTGSLKTSYQPIDNVKLVVRHKKAVNEEVRGARSRNIHSIYIQRGDERFKEARAMARHLTMGGEVHDTVGAAITEMATEYRQLNDFVKYVNKASLVNEDNEQYVAMAVENIQNIKSTFERVCGVKSYATAVESISQRVSQEVLVDDVDLESKFIETHFDDRVANAISSIKRSIGRQSKFEAEIAEAIKKESFSNLKQLLGESGDVIEFATPHARLSHQITQMGNASQNQTLSAHLHSISNKVASGGSLNQFEYGTIKSCLLSASEARVKTDVAESADQRYAAFIEQFDIL